jgi:integrase
LDWRAADGRRRRQALSTDKRVAERMRGEIIRARDLEDAGLGSVEGQSRPLKEIRDAYLADLATRACAQHVVNVTATLDRVLAAVPAQRVRDLRPLELVTYRSARLKAGLSHRSANLEIDVLRAALSWAVRLGLIAESPIRNLPRLKETGATRRYRRRALSEEEIARFLSAAYEDDRLNLERLAAVKSVEGGTKGVQWSLRRRKLRVPQAPLWRAFLETGCRYGELTRTVWSDIDLERRVLLLRAEHTKAGRSREVPLLEGLVGELRALRATHALVLSRPLRPSDSIFLSPEGRPWGRPTNNIARVFRRLLTAAGIDRVDSQGRKLDVHALRHSFASRLARSGVGLSQVARLPENTGSLIFFGEPLLFKAMAWLHFGILRPGYDIVLHPLGFAAWWGMLATALNLMPFGQLDGGHIVYAHQRCSPLHREKCGGEAGQRQAMNPCHAPSLSQTQPRRVEAL